MSLGFNDFSLAQGLQYIAEKAETSYQRPIVWLEGKEQKQLIKTLADVLPNLNHLANTASAQSGKVQYVSKAYKNLDAGLYQCLEDLAVDVCAHKSHLLGTQSSIFIFDAFAGFDPDLFCLTLGALQAPGLVLLLTPDQAEWGKSNQDSYRFLFRVISFLNSAEIVASFSVAENQWTKKLGKLSQSLPTLPAVDSEVTSNRSTESYAYTETQKLAIESIKKVVTGHRNRPLVITADRGRGKSAAVGAALSELFGEMRQDERVFVTAPTKASISVIWEHCSKKVKKENIQFFAPDELLLTDETPVLLVVDEAAAIPESILKQYLERFHRIVFVTTVHGYEGTGRGFELRFQPYLDQRYSNWKRIELTDPIRWGTSDLLEEWVNKTFLLAAEFPLSDEVDPKTIIEKTVLELITQEQLCQDNGLLTSLFGLLTQAHYRTSPGDLRDLLDANNFDIWLLKKDAQLLACCLIAREGGLDKDLIEQVSLGVRRPKGHLIAQSLCQHMGESLLAENLIARVVRIAVAPSMQGNGLGTYVLGELENHYRRQNFVAIGSSFSAHPNVNRFWLANGYLPLRLGFSKEASSGAHSLLVLKNLADKETVVQELSCRFIRAFIFLLGNEFRDLPMEVTSSIITQARITLKEAEDPNSRSIWLAFAKGGREFEDSRYFLVLLLMQSIERGSFLKLADQYQELLVECLLKHRSFAELRQRQLISGRKEGIKTLRQIASELLVLNAE